MFAQLKSLEEKSKFGGGHGGQAELTPVQGCYPEMLPVLGAVGTATGSFIEMENVSYVTAVQVRDGRSSLTQLRNALRSISSNYVL